MASAAIAVNGCLSHASAGRPPAVMSTVASALLAIVLPAAGAAALLLQAHPGRSPLHVKAMLMNSAETAVYTNPATLPGGDTGALAGAEKSTACSAPHNKPATASRVPVRARSTASWPR